MQIALGMGHRRTRCRRPPGSCRRGWRSGCPSRYRKGAVANDQMPFSKRIPAPFSDGTRAPRNSTFSICTRPAHHPDRLALGALAVGQHDRALGGTADDQLVLCPTAGCPRYVPGRISITSPSRACLAASLRGDLSPGRQSSSPGPATGLSRRRPPSRQRPQAAIGRPADFAEIIRRGRQLVADLGRNKRRHAEAGDHQELAPGLGKEGCIGDSSRGSAHYAAHVIRRRPPAFVKRAAAWHYSLPVTKNANESPHLASSPPDYPSFPCCWRLRRACQAGDL